MLTRIIAWAILLSVSTTSNLPRSVKMSNNKNLADALNAVADDLKNNTLIYGFKANKDKATKNEFKIVWEA